MQQKTFKFFRNGCERPVAHVYACSDHLAAHAHPCLDRSTAHVYPPAEKGLEKAHRPGLLVALFCHLGIWNLCRRMEAQQFFENTQKTRSKNFEKFLNLL